MRVYPLIEAVCLAFCLASYCVRSPKDAAFTSPQSLLSVRELGQSLCRMLTYNCFNIVIHAVYITDILAFLFLRQKYNFHFSCFYLSAWLRNGCLTFIASVSQTNVLKAPVQVSVRCPTLLRNISNVPLMRQNALGVKVQSHSTIAFHSPLTSHILMRSFQAEVESVSQV